MARVTRKGNPNIITLPLGARVIMTEVLRRDEEGEPITIRMITEE